MIVVVGLDKTTVQFLKEAGFVVTKPELEDFELSDWTNDPEIYEAVIVNLDKLSGPYLCRAIREKRHLVPVVGVAQVPASGWSEFRATFLENGGDDLLKAPVNPRELAAAVRAVTRRFKGSLLDIYTFEQGGMRLKVIPSLKRITLNENPVQLTVSHVRIINILASANGRIVSKEALLSSLYSNEADEPDMKIVDVFVCKIRESLKRIHPDGHNFVETVWGRGYRIAGNSQLKAAA